MSEAISMLRPACGKNLLLSVHMLAAYEYGRVNLKEQTGEIGGHDERAVMRGGGVWAVAGRAETPSLAS